MKLVLKLSYYDLLIIALSASNNFGGRIVSTKKNKKIKN